MYKIVLTGAPGSGKTTIFNELVKYYNSRKDTLLITVPETASELINSNIHPEKSKSVKDYQEIVFKRQIMKEETACMGMMNSTEKSDYNLIIHDRGVLDNKAYLESSKDFDSFLEKYGYSEIELLDKFDLVINLMSTACSDRVEYDKESNKARYENKDGAIKLITKTSNAWAGHKNIKIIDVTDTIEEKVIEVINLINNELNDIKIRKNDKYLIEEPDLSIYNEDNSRRILIDKYYIDCEKSPYQNLILNVRTYKGVSTYSLSLEGEYEGNRVIFNEKTLSSEKGRKYLEIYGNSYRVSKERISFIDNKQVYNIDIYDDCYTLEIEKQNGINNVIPDYIKPIDKYTENYDLRKALESKKEYVKTKKI